MTRRLAASLSLALLLATAPYVAAQDEAPAMTPEEMAEMEAYLAAGTAGAPHEMLAETAGTYELTIKSWTAPEGEPMVSSGTATRSMILDGRVRVEEVSSTMMGRPFDGYGMMGFDNVTGKYWSTWNDSLSTGIMISEGHCEEDGVCTFVGSWNDPITQGPFTVRMTSQWVEPSTELFTMHGPGKDGAEMKMMEIEYRKQ